MTRLMEQSKYDEACLNRQLQCAEAPLKKHSDGNCLVVDFPKEALRESHRDSMKQVRISPTSTLHQWAEEWDDTTSPAFDTSSWRSRGDIEMFRRKMKIEAAVIRNQLDPFQLEQLSFGITTVEESHITTTGIEHLLYKPTTDKLIGDRAMRIEAVLEEQSRQMADGIYDPVALRNASRAHSKWGRRRAFVLAGGSPVSRRRSRESPAAIAA